MGGAGQAMKRIPRIKFPQRHPKPSATSQQQVTAKNEAVGQTFFSRSPSNMSVGGKASDQPKRTPVSQEEIEAIMKRTRAQPFDEVSALAGKHEPWNALKAQRAFKAHIKCSNGGFKLKTSWAAVPDPRAEPCWYRETHGLLSTAIIDFE